MSASTTLSIDMISDVVCPWCYVGKRFLERAIASKPEIAVEVRFRPYFLNPWVPREGISREEYLTAKFGSVERYNSGNNRVVEAAAAAGLSYNRDLIKRQPNTLDCHRLIRWAAEEGQAGAMKQRLMELYFSEGGDLTQLEVLVSAAADCGLSPDAVRARLASEEDVEGVTREAQSAKEAGIEGVPFFIFGGVLVLSGAQPAEYIADAIERATAELAKRVAAE
ncbi:MAG TPA: DsbA family oxidoreductase [Xanthobacteraceae bacterium]|nr:DsbA family oxidoreductase [Xanthobacteraceae bacterium]